MMRRFTHLLFGLAIAGFFVAVPASRAHAWTTITHRATMVVVSVDVKANTITLQDEKGEKSTAPVLGDAVAKLQTLKEGMKVVVTCQDSDEGEHQGLIAIEEVNSPDEPEQHRNTHQATFEVVSVDLQAKTITLRADEQEWTLPVIGKALQKLENIEAGKTIKVTCQDNDDGEHQAILDIEILALPAR